MSFTSSPTQPTQDQTLIPLPNVQSVFPTTPNTPSQPPLIMITHHHHHHLYTYLNLTNMNTIPFLHNLDHLSEIAGLLLIYKTIVVSSLPMRLPLHLLTPNTLILTIFHMIVSTLITKPSLLVSLLLLNLLHIKRQLKNSATRTQFKLNLQLWKATKHGCLHHYLLAKT